MANICENKMYFQTSNQEDVETFSEFLREELRTCVSWEDEKVGEYYQAEVYFESRWDFPDNLMKEFTDKLKHQIYVILGSLVLKKVIIIALFMYLRMVNGNYDNVYNNNNHRK